MQKLERLGCSRSVVGLVVPSGYSFNLDGTNIYLTMAALFVAQALNIELTIMQQLTLLGVAMLTSKGASGVTGAGFITLAATLAVVPSIPVAGLALILGVDRFMSEARSMTNFVGNGVAAIVVSRWERGSTPRRWPASSLQVLSGVSLSVKKFPNPELFPGRKRAKIRETFSAAAGNRWVDTWNAQCPLPEARGPTPRHLRWPLSTLPCPSSGWTRRRC